MIRTARRKPKGLRKKTKRTQSHTHPDPTRFRPSHHRLPRPRLAAAAVVACRPPMAKTRMPASPPPAETPTPQRRRKKKGRPSLLDLQRRSLRLQAQNPSPDPSPTRREPNPFDDDEDGTGSGRRRQKRFKSVLSGVVKVGGLPISRQIFENCGVWGPPPRVFGRGTRGDAEL
jgi:hypothetical protein